MCLPSLEPNRIFLFITYTCPQPCLDANIPLNSVLPSYPTPSVYKMSALEGDLLSIGTLSLALEEPRQDYNASVYAPLDDPVNDIRLLEIIPERTTSIQDHQRLECRLSVHTLDDQLSYTALSYVWGDPGDTRPITIHGHEVQVTKNLAEALYQLRSDQTGPLWVDALCINQDNEDEKNHQVHRMSKIYRSAVEVIAWLSQDERITQKTFEVIRELAEMADSLDLPDSGAIRAEYLYDNVELTKTMCTRLLHESRFLEGDLGLLLSLMENTYWTRVWTIQEVCLARSATLHCGANKIQLSDILEATKILEWLGVLVANIHNHTVDEGFQEKVGSLYKPFEFVYSPQPPAFYISHYFNREGSSLGHLMIQVVHETKLECLDPRDRIYALLGLLEEEDRAKFPVDYAKPHTELFIQATLSLLPTAYGSRALLHAGLAYRNEGAEDDLPSWVVDWRCTRLRAEGLLNFYYLNKSASPSWDAIGDRKIAVRAAVGAEIKQVISSSKSLRDIVAFFEKVQRDHQLLREKRHVPADYSLEAMTWRTWIYSFTHYSLENEICETFERSMQSSDSDSYPSVGELQKLEEYGKKWRIDAPRNLFITTEGSIGSGPPCTRPGDVIHAFEGVDVPLLLRPSHPHTGEDEKRWKLVGPAFVSDMITDDGNDKVTLRDFWATEPENEMVVLV